jgi:hypothetical protein
VSEMFIASIGKENVCFQWWILASWHQSEDMMLQDLSQDDEFVHSWPICPPGQYVHIIDNTCAHDHSECGSQWRG